MPAAPITPAATILIVDDSPENLVVLSGLLRPLYRVLAATSGEAGLRVAGGQPKPDLILLDVMMPGMDGYAVLARLQAESDTAAMALYEEHASELRTALGAQGEQLGRAIGRFDFEAARETLLALRKDPLQP